PLRMKLAAVGMKCQRWRSSVLFRSKTAFWRCSGVSVARNAVAASAMADAARLRATAIPPAVASITVSPAAIRTRADVMRVVAMEASPPRNRVADANTSPSGQPLQGTAATVILLLGHRQQCRHGCPPEHLPGRRGPCPDRLHCE